MNRRDAIKTIGLGGIGLALAPTHGFSADPVAGPQPVLRVAHLTDIHLNEASRAPDKFARSLRHLADLPVKPDFIINGGDTIMDAFGVKEKSRNDAQWKLWNRVFDAECNLEIKHCIGNHDIWGLGPKSDSLHGKLYAMDQMKLRTPYYSFDRGGWHFIVLDSVSITATDCIGRLDDEQFAWLQQDLARTRETTPVMVTSHYPLLSATVFYPENAKATNVWEVPGAWMHVDFNRINDLFAQHRNVKVCVSGHMHQVDQVTYDGVTYCCNGAVCGNWWGNENYYRSKAGYAVMNLFSDGTFSRDFHHPSWA